MPIKVQKDAQDAYPLQKMGDTDCAIDDIFSSEETNPTSPISCGLFTVAAGEPLTYTYKYDETKIILEGEGELKDADGEAHAVKKGDVISIQKGTTVIFSSKTFFKAFYVGQRRLRDW